MNHSALAPNRTATPALFDTEVKPNKGLVPFYLGMSMPAAIEYIQKQYSTIPHVELKFVESNLLSSWIIVDLVEQGLLLKFEPRMQRLIMIEVYDLTKMTLRYAHEAFSGPKVLPTLTLIQLRFGGAQPGEYDKETGIYNLYYPNGGICFKFEIPEDFPPFGQLEMPVKGGLTPVAKSLLIYYNEGTIRKPVLPPLSPNDLYFELINVVVSKGIHFPQRGCQLDFGSSTQDVVTELGKPDRIFCKGEDKMRIHSGDKSMTDTVCEDYFYNYFSLGMDILFDMQTHLIKKFVLHTNYPCHMDFNIYSKCNYRIYLNEADVPREKPVNAKRDSPMRRNADTEKEKEEGEESNGEHSDEGEQEATEEIEEENGHGEEEHKDEEAEGKEDERVRAITPDMQWDDIKAIVLPDRDPPRPVMHSVTIDSPFGQTRFYGARDIIFEVMRNDLIASVTLFKDDTLPSTSLDRSTV